MAPGISQLSKHIGPKGDKVQHVEHVNGVHPKNHPKSHHQQAKLALQQASAVNENDAKGQTVGLLASKPIEDRSEMKSSLTIHQEDQPQE